MRTITLPTSSIADAREQWVEGLGAEVIQEDEHSITVRTLDRRQFQLVPSPPRQSVNLTVDNIYVAMMRLEGHVEFDMPSETRVTGTDGGGNLIILEQPTRRAA